MRGSLAGTLPDFDGRPADTGKRMMGRLRVRRRQRRPARGSIEKVREVSLGEGRVLQVHKLTAPQDPEIVAAMEQARRWAEEGLRERAAALAYEVWRRARGDKFVEVWAGQMVAKHGDPERAVEIYCASEDLSAGDWQAYWHLGVFLAACGERARAVTFLEKAVRIEPRAVDVHLDLARCLMALGRTEEAKRSLHKARELDPSVRL